MKAIDIYNFRRKIEQSNLQNIDTSVNIIAELIDLNNSINFAINSWTIANLEKIKYEGNKTV